MGTSGSRCQRFRLGWVTAGGALMAREKEVTLPRPLDLHRPWPCSSEPSGEEKEPAPWVPPPTTPIPKVWKAPYNLTME